MSTQDTDRQAMEVGTFIRNDDCGAEYLIDAIASNPKLCELIGQLIQCGDDTAIGTAVRKAACTYRPLLDAIERDERIERWKERQLEIALAMEPDDRHYGEMGVRL